MKFGGFEVRQPYVRGYEPHPIYPMHVGRAWIDRTAGARTASRDTPPPLRGVLASIFGSRP